MGARPMARVIQTQIKTPLADEVLFGRLKNGGVVKVVVTADETGEKKLGFVYPEGPAQPRLERDIIVAAKARGRSRKRVEPADSGGPPRSRAGRAVGSPRPRPQAGGASRSASKGDPESARVAMPSWSVFERSSALLRIERSAAAKRTIESGLRPRGRQKRTGGKSPFLRPTQFRSER